MPLRWKRILNIEPLVVKSYKPRLRRQGSYLLFAWKFRTLIVLWSESSLVSLLIINHKRIVAEFCPQSSVPLLMHFQKHGGHPQNTVQVYWVGFRVSVSFHSNAKGYWESGCREIQENESLRSSPEKFLALLSLGLGECMDWQWVNRDDCSFTAWKSWTNRHSRDASERAGSGAVRGLAGPDKPVF